MIAFLDKLEDIINKVIGVILVPCFSLIAVVSFMQVISRYVLKVPLPWSEELCRYLFIYATYLGAVIAVTRKQHVDITAIDIFLDKIEPEEKRKHAYAVLSVITSFLSALALTWITCLSIPYLIKVYGFGQVTPAMRISLCIPVFSVPMGMGLMSVLYIKRFLKELILLPKGGASVE